MKVTLLILGLVLALQSCSQFKGSRHVAQVIKPGEVGNPFIEAMKSYPIDYIPHFNYGSMQISLCLPSFEELDTLTLEKYYPRDHIKVLMNYFEEDLGMSEEAAEEKVRQLANKQMKGDWFKDFDILWQVLNPKTVLLGYGTQTIKNPGAKKAHYEVLGWRISLEKDIVLLAKKELAEQSSNCAVDHAFNEQVKKFNTLQRNILRGKAAAIAELIINTADASIATKNKNAKILYQGAVKDLINEELLHIVTQGANVIDSLAITFNDLDVDLVNSVRDNISDMQFIKMEASKIVKRYGLKKDLANGMILNLQNIRLLQDSLVQINGRIDYKNSNEGVYLGSEKEKICHLSGKAFVLTEEFNKLKPSDEVSEMLASAAKEYHQAIWSSCVESGSRKKAEAATVRFSGQLEQVVLKKMVDEYGQ